MKPDLKNPVLVDVVAALAVSDPDRAERIVRSITGRKLKLRALLAIVKAC
jgi:hypothetical protein